MSASSPADPSSTQPVSDGAFVPFANESDALTLGELNVENHTDHIALFGNLEIRRDAEGLRQAQALKAVFDAVVAALATAEPGASTPATAGTTARQVKNPFES
ncbi:hypothetical protein PMO31116_02405 [Pandoraea morbifera]|uniref:Uncharacterized protein n=1 Tax=Pandoraea morbifera TaxID=2508300 RepID=A0A5E4V897_9BURK|nr:hypothetical protein [Pandoraea morbifera]VVE07090.1 hypothetical protein PMO31116_02405 [Pandoraea morbifera]